MTVLRIMFDRYDARSLATLISTGGVLPLPIVTLLAPDTLRPGSLVLLLIIWSFIAAVFVITAIRSRLTDAEFAVLGGLGIIGICGTALILSNKTSAMAVLALVAAIPTIAAISPSIPLMLSLSSLAAVGAVVVLAVIAATPAAFVISVGAILGSITVPLFLVIALRRSLEATLERQTQLSGIDPLTGLLNRRGFLSRVAPLLSAAHVSTGWVGILLMDIDHFKRVNDVYGHLAGDGVLLTTAAAIREVAPPGSVVCRFGGEEFLVFCVARDEAELRIAAERFRLAVSEAAPVTVSVGGVCAPLIASSRSRGASTDEVVSQMLDRADHCVYQAKTQGRDRTIIEPMDPVLWRRPAVNPGAVKPHDTTLQYTVFELFSRQLGTANQAAERS
ncbi:sensor domain-containing diguanylate cyclase [Gordonia sp. SL306]|uniref:GGDEF domain-containing protein n=1 Tax=Gordonia sp. SL306 TaxID=2995145 RepID=UPI00227139C7|nr:GGDEF domain-containing protein [Gordonia sp. SL306]WAC56765.1 GGDEF domain-containing protein [Gordonia sp. SL306]